MARRASPHPTSFGGRRSLFERLKLIVEILAAYGPCLLALRGNDLHHMLAEARGAESRPKVPSEETTAVEAVSLGTIVRRVLAVLPTERRCLIRSLVLVRLLERRGLQNTLVIGVDNVDRFAAHAWVEHDGIRVLPAGTFQPLLKL